MKKWVRSKENRMLGGVLGGLAEHTNIDPTIIRIIFLVLWLTPSIVSLPLIYIILWILLPEEVDTTE